MNEPTERRTAPAKIWVSMPKIGHPLAWLERATETDTEFVNASIVADLVAALEATQWNEQWYDNDRQRRCLVCARSPELGHRPECRVGAALSNARAAASNGRAS